MSMSTQHGGGNRKPSTKPVAGGKPADELEELEEKPTSSVDVSDEDDSVDSAVDAAADDDSSDEDPKAPVTVKKAPAKAKANPRKSAPPRKTSAKSTPAKAGSANRPKPGQKAAAGRRIAPVKVQQERPWGAIALFTAVAVVAVGIIGFAGYQVYQNGLTWQERADKINGIVNYHKKDPQSLTYEQHTYGQIKYKYNPPVGGTHNPNWQRCLGDVYNAPIASEHAVHSEEHGAVWITYRPGLPADQIETLAKKVRGHDFTLMSPFEGLDAPISLQTWGYQLKVDNASDPRIDEFIKTLRQKAAFEQGATCSSGNMITETGTTPRDLGKDQPNQGGQQPGQNGQTGG
jgi:hypothetical protein